MTPSLSGHITIFGLVFFVLKSLLGIARQQSGEKVAILPQKPGVSVQIKNKQTIGDNLPPKRTVPIRETKHNKHLIS